MCRLTIYKGQPILIGNIVIEPENSLLYQSRDAAYHPGVVDKCHQRNILVNGDGFGVSWYGLDASMGSCCFKFVTPAWSDTNLRNIGRHIASPLLFAHVRAAASGHNPHEPMIVSNENCHPFTYKQYTFMHNGGIPCFKSIKLKILNLLSPETFANIKGTTDTEHIFAIYLNCLPPFDTEVPHTVSDMVDAMNQTISIIVQLCKENDITEHCSLNLCVTNGTHIIATRFRNGPRSPPSLYYNLGSNFVCKNGHFYAEDDSIGAEIVISSAPLSKVCCPQDQSTEVEQDVSYYEEELGSPHTPYTPHSPPGQNTTHTATTHNSGLRPSASSNSLRAVLQQQAHGNTCKADAVLAGCMAEGDPDSGSDSDIGSWILIPKNHMLVCRGEANSHKVECTYLEPIVLRSSPGPLSCPLRACKRKCRTESFHLSAPVSSSNVVDVIDNGAAKKPNLGAAVESLGLDIDAGSQHGSGAASCTSVEVVNSVDGVDVSVASAALAKNVHASPSSGHLYIGSPAGKPRPKIMKFTCQL